MIFSFLKKKTDKKELRTDFYSSLYPLFLTSSFLGLSPHITRKNDGGREIRYSIYPILKSLLLMLLYVLTLCYSFYAIERSNGILCGIRLYKDIFSSILYSCEIALGCVFAKNTVVIFENIKEVDEKLRKLNMFVSYEKMYVCIIVTIILTFLGLGAISILFIRQNLFVYCYKYQLPSISMIILTYYIPFIGNFLMEMQYFHYLNILRQCYKQLNENLGKITTNANSLKNDYKNKLAIRRGLILVAPKLIDNKEDVYDHVYLLNQQLFKFTITFVSIVTALFMFATIFTATDSDNVYIDAPFMVWAASNGIEIFIIVWISSETSEEANYCSILLHRIRNETNNEKLKSLVDLYSLQMYHNKLRFTICGLFPLDYTLLYTIVAGVTTYLVILIQFNLDIVKTYGNETNPNFTKI